MSTISLARGHIQGLFAAFALSGELIQRWLALCYKIFVGQAPGMSCIVPTFDKRMALIVPL
jgi:hypothetical protein